MRSGRKQPVPAAKLFFEKRLELTNERGKSWPGRQQMHRGAGGLRLPTLNTSRASRGNDQTFASEMGGSLM